MKRITTVKLTRAELFAVLGSIGAELAGEPPCDSNGDPEVGWMETIQSAQEKLWSAQEAAGWPNEED